MEPLDIRISGRRLVVDVAGTGMPCVLLHPFPFHRRYFAGLTPRLTRARTIVPDLRGFGDSELGGPFSIADLADDVAALLDHLKIDRAVVGGVSMGGYVALAFAARHPRRLAGLVLADTRAGADGEAARANRQADLDLVSSEGGAALIAKQLPKLLSPSASDAQREEVRALAETRSETLTAAIAALRDRPDRQRELPAITCPALVIVGTEDVITPPAEAAAIATAVPRAVLVELPGVGHLANLEAPQPFAQAINGFVARAHAEISAPRS